MRIALAAGLLTAALVGCGDIGTLQLALDFDPPALEDATRGLRVVIREGPTDGSTGCDALWGAPPAGLRQTTAVTAYPNQDDVLAAAVSLEYPVLSLFVYAHSEIDRVASEEPGGEERLEVLGDAFAGGCVDQPIDDASVSTEVPLVLAPAP